MEKKGFRRRNVIKRAPLPKPGTPLHFPDVSFGPSPPSRVPHRSRLEVEARALSMEWAVTAPVDSQPKDWLVQRGLSATEVNRMFGVMPATQWYDKRKDLQDHVTAKLVKRHVDSVAEMNDQHISAARLGMARAIEFMTKLRVEEGTDPTGRPYFRGFRTVDLLNAMSAIEKAQKIQRMALGLNTDEGSINVWQTINNTLNTGGEQGREQVEELEKMMSYEEIKVLIASERARQKTIDVDVESDS